MPAANKNRQGKAESGRLQQTQAVRVSIDPTMARSRRTWSISSAGAGKIRVPASHCPGRNRPGFICRNSQRLLMPKGVCRSKSLAITTPSPNLMLHRPAGNEERIEPGDLMTMITATQAVQSLLDAATPATAAAVSAAPATGIAVPSPYLPQEPPEARSTAKRASTTPSTNR